MAIKKEQIDNKMTQTEFENNLVKKNDLDICLFFQGRYIYCPHDIIGIEKQKCSNFEGDCKACWSHSAKYIEFKKEESDIMFTKNDLKSGMVVKNRSGRFYLVVEGTLIGEEWCRLSHFKEDLSNNYSNLDIMKVWDIKEEDAYFRKYTALHEVERRFTPVFDRDKIIDWSRVQVDTKVLVKDKDDSKWLKRYFAKYEDGKVYTFGGGATSFSFNGCSYSSWDEAKLYEE